MAQNATRGTTLPINGKNYNKNRPTFFVFFRLADQYFPALQKHPRSYLTHSRGIRKRALFSRVKISIAAIDDG